MSKLKACSVPTCLRPAAAHGLCRAHHDRLRKSGSTKSNLPILALDNRHAKGAIVQLLKHRVRP